MTPDQLERLVVCAEGVVSFLDFVKMVVCLYGAVLVLGVLCQSKKGD